MCYFRTSKLASLCKNADLRGPYNGNGLLSVKFFNWQSCSLIMCFQWMLPVIKEWICTYTIILSETKKIKMVIQMVLWSNTVLPVTINKRISLCSIGPNHARYLVSNLKPKNLFLQRHALSKNPPPPPCTSHDQCKQLSHSIPAAGTTWYKILNSDIQWELYSTLPWMHYWHALLRVHAVFT